MFKCSKPTISVWISQFQVEVNKNFPFLLFIRFSITRRARTLLIWIINSKVPLYMAILIVIKIEKLNTVFSITCGCFESEMIVRTVNIKCIYGRKTCRFLLSRWTCDRHALKCWTSTLLRIYPYCLSVELYAHHLIFNKEILPSVALIPCFGDSVYE